LTAFAFESSAALLRGFAGWGGLGDESGENVGQVEAAGGGGGFEGEDAVGVVGAEWGCQFGEPDGDQVSVGECAVH